MRGDDDHRVHPDRPGNCARTRHEPSADPRDPPGRVSQRSTHLIVTAWPRSRSSRQSNSSDEIPSLHWPLPPLIAGRKLALFACPISPGLALNFDLPMINVRANLALFWRFSIIASSLPSASLTAGHYPLAPRSTPHAPRPTRRHPPGPAGASRARTLPRWLLLGTNHRIAKDPTGPDLDERPLLFQYVTEAGGSSDKINSLLPTRRRPTVDHSLVASGTNRRP